MPSEENFLKNVALWARYCPQEAADLREEESRSVTFCKTPDGDLNLRCNSEHGPFLLHSNSNPLEEAKTWFHQLHLRDIKVLFVYGIGLGYIYEAAKEWLKGDQNNLLVFVESNPEIIRRFFETDRATEFLTNPQAFIYLVGDSAIPGSKWTLLCNASFI